jgi:ethanolamine utilization protein EutQ (cupin superfamily)
MSQYKVDFDAIPWESPMEGLRFKAQRQGGRQLRLVEYTRDMQPHWCEKGHIGYILEGEFEIRFEGEVVLFRAGDGVFLPPGPADKHMGKVLSDVVRVVFVEDVE